MRVESLTMSNVLLFAFLNVCPDQGFYIIAFTFLFFQLLDDVIIVFFGKHNRYPGVILFCVLLDIFQLIKVSGFLPAQSVYSLLSSVILFHTAHYVNNFSCEDQKTGIMQRKYIFLLST